MRCDECQRNVDVVYPLWGRGCVCSDCADVRPLSTSPAGRIAQVGVLLDPAGDGSIPPMITPEQARELLDLAAEGGSS